MAGKWYRKYLPALLKQEATYKTNLQIEGEKAKIEIAQAETDLKEHEFYNDLIKVINNPETIDLTFLKKYGIIFLIFFILLWYLTKRRK